MDLFFRWSIEELLCVCHSIYPYINSSIITRLAHYGYTKWGRDVKEEEGKGRSPRLYPIWHSDFSRCAGNWYDIGYSRSRILYHHLFDWLHRSYFKPYCRHCFFLLWLGELITDKGIGNGISLFIFGSIVSSIPRELGTLHVLLDTGQTKWYNVLGCSLYPLLRLSLLYGLPRENDVCLCNTPEELWEEG